MADTPVPPVPPVPAPSPSSSPAVDSLSAANAIAAPVALLPQTDAVARAKKRILLLGGMVYAMYFFWCVFLILTLPEPTGKGGPMVSAGLLTSLLGVVGLGGAGALLLKRISNAPTSIATRRLSLIKTIAVLTPGILISVVTPLLIIREPSLPLDISQPTNAADFIAPVSVTFSAERTAGILRNLGMRPVKYLWDTDGDGKLNEETVLPTATVVYERQGVYVPAVMVQLEGGDSRRLTRRVSIPQAVFSMVPVQPIVEKPVKFSVATLLPDPKQLKQVQWDFGDGNPAKAMTTPDIAHTFYVIGAYPITAVVQLQNGSQIAYKRTVTVQEQPPLPFPVTLITEPGTLIGPAPFGIIFRLDTKEDLKEITWSYGDGKEDRGATLLRESHVFEAPGIFPVVARARNSDGQVAELNAFVRVTEPLTVANLRFEGKPAVQGTKISGEVPLEISLTPKAATPLVEFSWEIPPGQDLTVKDGTLTGILREEGTTTVTLLAQGAEGKSMRMPITIDVKPPSAEPVILMSPDGGVAPLTVTFDASQTFVPPEETVAGFRWIFGDEAQGKREPELGGARVTHTYEKPGEYKVQLTVVLASGKSFTADKTMIVRRPTLSACITASRLEVEVGKGIEFDSTCSTGDPSSLLWDVRRDDQPTVVQAQSNDEVYVYVFEETGDYTVTLSLKDSFGGQEKKTVSISVIPPSEEPPEEPSP